MSCSCKKYEEQNGLIKRVEPLPVGFASFFLTMEIEMQRNDEVTGPKRQTLSIICSSSSENVEVQQETVPLVNATTASVISEENIPFQSSSRLKVESRQPSSPPGESSRYSQPFFKRDRSELPLSPPMISPPSRRKQTFFSDPGRPSRIASTQLFASRGEEILDGQLLQPGRIITTPSPSSPLIKTGQPFVQNDQPTSPSYGRLSQSPLPPYDLMTETQLSSKVEQSTLLPEKGLNALNRVLADGMSLKSEHRQPASSRLLMDEFRQPQESPLGPELSPLYASSLKQRQPKQHVNRENKYSTGGTRSSSEMARRRLDQLEESLELIVQNHRREKKQWVEMLDRTEEAMMHQNQKLADQQQQELESLQKRFQAREGQKRSEWEQKSARLEQLLVDVETQLNRERSDWDHERMGLLRQVELLKIDCMQQKEFISRLMAEFEGSFPQKRKHFKGLEDTLEEENKALAKKQHGFSNEYVRVDNELKQNQRLQGYAKSRQDKIEMLRISGSMETSESSEGVLPQWSSNDNGVNTSRPLPMYFSTSASATTEPCTNVNKNRQEKKQDNAMQKVDLSLQNSCDYRATMKYNRCVSEVDMRDSANVHLPQSYGYDPIFEQIVIERKKTAALLR